MFLVSFIGRCRESGLPWRGGSVSTIVTNQGTDRSCALSNWHAHSIWQDWVERHTSSRSPHSRLAYCAYVSTAVRIGGRTHIRTHGLNRKMVLLSPAGERSYALNINIYGTWKDRHMTKSLIICAIPIIVFEQHFFLLWENLSVPLSVRPSVRPSVKAGGLVLHLSDYYWSSPRIVFLTWEKHRNGGRYEGLTGSSRSDSLYRSTLSIFVQKWPESHVKMMATKRAHEKLMEFGELTNTGRLLSTSGAKPQSAERITVSKGEASWGMRLHSTSIDYRRSNLSAYFAYAMTYAGQTIDKSAFCPPQKSLVPIQLAQWEGRPYSAEWELLNIGR